ncbi:MAG: alginate export family protein [Candidatus Omnitrophota bacterium]|nr:alginate export family protein [Candidatus Omnitrophota bacterium]
MSRFLKLMSILAIVALIAVPAFAEVQNVKVSGDIDSKAISRNQYDFSNGNSNGNAQPGTFSYNDNDTWFNTTARVQVDADLTDNVSTVVRLLNERDWGVEAPAGNTSGDTTIALDLANVKMKEIFCQPLALTIGRQNIRLGSGLVVGDPDTNDMSVNGAAFAGDLSVRKSFDAIKATLDYNPLTVDLIMAKIDSNTVGRALTTTGSRTKDDVDLYAVNAAYKFNKYNSELEGYLITKIDQSIGTTTPLKDQVNVYGIRGSLEPISKLILDAELAYQNGSYADATISRTIDREAWAGDVGAQLAVGTKWSPVLAARYSYRSGQQSPGTDADADAENYAGGQAKTNKYEAWDTMFEDQTHGIIANAIFSNNNDGVDSNGHTINVMASVVPLQDLTVAVDYYHYLLAEKWYSDNQAGSTLSNRIMNNGNTSYEVKDKTDLGDEVDVSLAYDYTEDVKLGLTAGFFLPGKAFQTNNENMASTVMADVKVSF